MNGTKHYTIGEVSEIVDLKEHVLRYWEKEFQELAPEKSTKGRRRYYDRDIYIIEKIKALLYDKGFTISGAQKELPNELNNNTSYIPKKKREPMPSPINSSPNLSSNERQMIVRELRDIAELLK